MTRRYCAREEQFPYSQGKEASRQDWFETMGREAINDGDRWGKKKF